MTTKRLQAIRTWRRQATLADLPGNSTNEDHQSIAEQCGAENLQREEGLARFSASPPRRCRRSSEKTAYGWRWNIRRPPISRVGSEELVRFPANWLAIILGLDKLVTAALERSAIRPLSETGR